MQPHEPCKTYRTSHTPSEYGQRYRLTYAQGYYHYQWDQIEKPILAKLVEEQRIRGARSLLDFACGCGRILSFCESSFETAWGVDVSESMLAEARQVCQTSSLFQQDMTVIPLERTFDVVTAFRFFLNAEPTLRSEALRSIHQALNPEGVLIANVHVNSLSILGHVYRLRNAVHGRTIANTLSFRAFESTLQANGFQIERTIWYGFLPRTGFGVDRLSKYLIRPVEKAWQAFHLPRSMAQCFICVCHKVK